MAGLRRTLDELRAYHQKLKGLLGKEAGRSWQATPAVAADRLLETARFGSNPGNLRMLSYVPDALPAAAPLVVVLHGCTQTAAGYDSATGWSRLADRFGFALLYPEQKRENNPNGCFNWFQPADIARDRGEDFSIKQMIDRMVEEHDIDRRRVTITGLSAGGAMVAVMLATYPELFAAGAIIAGLPFGCAANVQQAFECMMQGRARPAEEWAALVRHASSHAGPWPKVSVWHGDADSTVLPVNADELIKQWTAIHGLSPRPSLEGKVDGFPFRAWQDRAGEILVESLTITGMGHGAPIAPGAAKADHGYGQAAPFILDMGISSTYHIARGWGLTDAETAAPAAAAQRAPHAAPTLAVPVPEAREAPPAAYWNGAMAAVKRASAIDPAVVIQDALRAAGLMK